MNFFDFSSPNESLNLIELLPEKKGEPSAIAHVSPFTSVGLSILVHLTDIPISIF